MTDIKNLNTRDYLTAFLNLFWLRPETALWRTLDCLALKDIPFEGPILDVGCGDGLFSFTRAGGAIDPAYDPFLQAGNLNQYFDNADIYDHYNKQAAVPSVVREPVYSIDLGLDHKSNLLMKAKSTGLYRNVQQHDLDTGLPEVDIKFKTIFSNMLYWLPNYRTTLKDIQSVLADDGRVVLTVPSETFRDYSFYQRLHVKTNDPQWQWLQLLDRGRSDSIKLCYSLDEWSEIFLEAGLSISHHRRYLSKTVLEAWDIGLRPLSPLLIEMSNKLDTTDRTSIKEKWVQSLIPLMEPLCELDWVTDHRSPPGFFMFVLEKSK